MVFLKQVTMHDSPSVTSRSPKAGRGTTLAGAGKLDDLGKLAVFPVIKILQMLDVRALIRGVNYSWVVMLAGFWQSQAVTVVFCSTPIS
jgi:hypothetical protein